MLSDLQVNSPSQPYYLQAWLESVSAVVTNLDQSANRSARLSCALLYSLAAPVSVHLTCLTRQMLRRLNCYLTSCLLSLDTESRHVCRCLDRHSTCTPLLLFLSRQHTNQSRCLHLPHVCRYLISQQTARQAKDGQAAVRHRIQQLPPLRCAGMWACLGLHPGGYQGADCGQWSG